MATRFSSGRGVIVPVVVGVVALLLGGVFAFTAFRGDPEPAATAASVSPVATKPLVHRKGGFSVEVPTGLKPSRQGRTVTLASKDKSLVVTIGPGEPGPLKRASTTFVRVLKQSYEDVQLTGSEKQRVDGRPALLTAGQATNAKGVRIRFVTVHVRNRPQNYAVTAYTARDSDPAIVLPRVNAIVNSFTVLSSKR